MVAPLAQGSGEICTGQVFLQPIPFKSYGLPYRQWRIISFLPFQIRVSAGAVSLFVRLKCEKNIGADAARTCQCGVWRSEKYVLHASVQHDRMAVVTRFSRHPGWATRESIFRTTRAKPSRIKCGKCCKPLRNWMDGNEY